MKVPNIKFSRELTYKLVCSLLPVLVRFSRSTGISDVTSLADYINSLTVDQFCDFKFTDVLEVSNDMAD